MQDHMCTCECGSPGCLPPALCSVILSHTSVKGIEGCGHSSSAGCPQEPRSPELHKPGVGGGQEHQKFKVIFYLNGQPRLQETLSQN